MTAMDRRAPDPAVLGGARVVASCLVVHPEWSSVRSDVHASGRPTGPRPVVVGGHRAGLLRLAGPAVEIVALGQSVNGVLIEFDRLAGCLATSAPHTSAAVARYVARAN